MVLDLTTGNALRATSGMLLMGLGVAIILIRPRRHANVAFAAFCFFLGTPYIFRNLFNVAAWAALVGALTAPLLSLAGLALLFFAAWYPRPIRATERRLLLPPGALLVGLVAAKAAAIFRGEVGVYEMDVALECWFAALLLMALRFEAARSEASQERRQLALVSGVLLLFPTYVSAEGGLNPQTTLWFAWLLASFVIALAWLWVMIRTEGESKHLARNLALLTLAVMLATGLLRLAAGSDWVREGSGGGRGIVRSLTVVAAAYTILRHQLLGIDVKVKWTLKQSTVAAIFFGLFFVVSESAAAFFSNTVGTYLGILTAGLLVFAIAPLQHFAQRVADRAMPGVKTVGQMTADERLELYRGQLRVAWADGSVSLDERRMLDLTREKLHIDAHDAVRLEKEITSGMDR